MKNNQIYRENILNLYRNPSNKGNLKNPTKTHILENPFCGDKIKVELKISKEIIEDVKFSGNGCAISIASASLTTDKVKGMKIKEIMDLKADNIQELIGIKLSPTRLRCATMCLEAIKLAIRKNARN